MVLALRFFSPLLKTGLKLPDISELNGTAIDNVAEFDGLTVSGVAPVVPAAAAAYSVRLLDSLLGTTYTGVAMRIRRVTGTNNTGNDDEADVAFDSGVISLDSAVSNFSAGGSNATTLGQFLNVGTVNGTAYTDADSLSPNTAAAYVDEWKDQSGNANHFEQSTPASQFQIHVGTVDTDLITKNGKPALFPTSVAVGFEPISVDLSNSDVSEFLVAQCSVNFAVATQYGTNNILVAHNNYNTGTDGVFQLAQSTNASYYLDGQQESVTQTRGTTKDQFYLNQRLASLCNFQPTASGISIENIANFFRVYVYQELVIYDSDQSDNRATIEENINSNFLIYQPTDAPTSGLLYDYGSATGGTDAAAAYSVRQLSDKAVLCMRIRRDMGAGNPGDDDEINIGFDSNGDLDTQAISDFCGTGTGWVTRWWDQSVNGNHADQPVGGTGSNTSQPQIYNGTAVITENGKPAVQFDGSNDYFDISWTQSASDYSLHAVTKNNATDSFLFDSTTGRLVFDGRGGSRGVYFDGSWRGTMHSGTSQQLQSIYAISPSNGQSYVDGSQINTGLSYSQKAIGGNTVIGSEQSGTTLHFDGTIQEWILYASDQSSNRTGIETNIDTYYQIPGM